MEEKIEVEIFHTKFTLISSDKERTAKIANFVDSKMKEIYKITGISSSLKISILTALNIADELFSLKERYENDLKPDLKDFLVNKILSLTDRINNMLDSKLE